MENEIPNKYQNYINRVENEDYYKKILKIIKIFDEVGLIFRSKGQCIGTSDLISKLLKEEGVESQLIECSLSVLDRSPINKINFVGYETKENKNHQFEIETHVVCVTKTEIPILIDLTVQSSKINYICFPIFNDLILNENNIITLDFGHSLWIYNKKEINFLPNLHQKSILERIETDNKFEKQIKNLKKIVIFVATISSLNFIRGLYDHYQKYIIKDNGFGPNKVLVDKTEKNVYK